MTSAEKERRRLFYPLQKRIKDQKDIFQCTLEDIFFASILL